MDTISFGILGTFIGLLGMAFYLWWMYYFFNTAHSKIRYKIAKILKINIKIDMEGSWWVSPTSRNWLFAFAIEMVVALIQIIVLVSYIMIPFGIFIISYHFLLNFLARLLLS